MLANTMSLAKQNFDLVLVIPTFSGDERESVADFISKIDDNGTSSGWTSEYKIIVAKQKVQGNSVLFFKIRQSLSISKDSSRFTKGLRKSV